jgi:uncharacterized protein (TIGR03435 family)
MYSGTRIAGVLLTLAASGLAQPAGPGLTFEVASIKQAASGQNGVRGGCHGIDSTYTASQLADAPPLGRCRITDARLSHLIGIAYGVTMQNLKTGPDWIQRGDQRFHVEGEAADSSKATEKELLTMLQNLLVERFDLKFHYERSETAGFVLNVAKNGPKLKTSSAPEPKMLFHSPTGEVMSKPALGQPISMTVQKFQIAQLISMLSALGNGPGLDQTGLKGEYDFSLAWDENAGPNLSTALREQLGLRFEPAKVPNSTLVVDSAAKPTAN